MTSKDIVVDTVDVNGKPLKLKLQHITNKIAQMANNVYNVKVSQLIKEGSDTGERLMLRSEMEEHLKKSGIWTDQDSAEVEKISIEIRSRELLLSKGGLKIHVARDIAIQMGRGQNIEWLGPAGIAGARINSFVDTSSENVSLIFEDNRVELRNTAGKRFLQARAVASGVNLVDILQATAGNGPTISAIGDSTDIDLHLASKGTGQLILDDVTIAIDDVKIGGSAGDTPSARIHGVDTTAAVAMLEWDNDGSGVGPAINKDDVILPWP